MTALKIFIGADQRQTLSYDVCVKSLRRHSSAELIIIPLRLSELRASGVYTREHRENNGQLWDVLSDAPMSTEFAFTRFLVPYLSEYEGWSLYVDNDFMFRADIGHLFALADPFYPVMVTKPFFEQTKKHKMNGKVQTSYARKLWSPLILYNCGHHACKRLTSAYVNAASGMDLHQFHWLISSEIGQLPNEWAHFSVEPKAVHFTTGTPNLPGYENVPYANEWREYTK